MIIIYLIICILLMSFIEWFIHRYIMHNDTISTTIYYNHARLHHREYFKVFNHETDKAGKQLNIKLDIGNALLIGLPIFLFFYYFSPMFCFTFICVLIIHHLIWNIIHDEMHNPQYNWRRFIPGYLFLEQYHWLHHKYTGKNYNVVFPICDYIFGTNIKPTEKDLEQMRTEL